MWPLIAAAEQFEATPARHDHGAAEPIWSPEGRLRPTLTVLFNIAAGLGFGLILNALTRLWTLRSGRPFTASDGILWGAAGFAAFSLAPAFGMPPELPGMASGELLDRQLWWLATGCCTAGGIAFLVYSPGIWRSAGIALIVLPHLIGAPRADEYGSVPGEMAAAFATASLSGLRGLLGCSGLGIRLVSATAHSGRLTGIWGQMLKCRPTFPIQPAALQAGHVGSRDTPASRPPCAARGQARSTSVSQ